MDNYIRIENGKEMDFFKDYICNDLGDPSNWGPYSYSSAILDLFWSTHLRYNDRFKLTLFAWNNPLPREYYYAWLAHRNVLRDKKAWDHLYSMFHDWDNGKNMHYETYSIIKQEFET